MIEIIGKQIYLDDKYEIKEYFTSSGNVRALFSNGCIESSTYIEKSNIFELCNEYYKFFNIPIYLNPKGIDYLVLGGGGFSYPKYYISKYKNKKMTVVEIDKNCVDYAKKYFYLDELINRYDPLKERLNIIIEDAIKYINDCSKTFDYILIDLFKGRKPSEEIYEEEVLKKIKNILNKNGIIIVNYIISEENKCTYKEELNKLTKITKFNKIITNKNYYDESKNIGNIIILLSETDITIPSIYNYYEIKKCKLIEIK